MSTTSNKYYYLKTPINVYNLWENLMEENLHVSMDSV